MKSNLNSNGDIIIYQSEDGVTKINVNLQDETVWLSQRLKEYMIKGFTMDDERLKGNTALP